MEKITFYTFSVMIAFGAGYYYGRKHAKKKYQQSFVPPVVVVQKRSLF